MKLPFMWLYIHHKKGERIIVCRVPIFPHTVFRQFDIFNASPRFDMDGVYRLI